MSERAPNYGPTEWLQEAKRLRAELKEVRQDRNRALNREGRLREALREIADDLDGAVRGVIPKQALERLRALTPDEQGCPHCGTRALTAQEERSGIIGDTPDEQEASGGEPFGAQLTRESIEAMERKREASGGE